MTLGLISWRFPPENRHASRPKVILVDKTAGQIFLPAVFLHAVDS